MSVIAFGSFKNAPGVTTAVVGVAATWAGEVMIVEAEMSGGDIGPRFGLNPDSGVASVAAAARRSTAVAIDEHAQELPGGLRCLLAPASPDHARAAVGYFATSASRILRATEGDVLIDCGQLVVNTTRHPILDVADHAVICVRPELANIRHALASVIHLKQSSASVLIIGDGPYSDDEIESALDIPVLGRLPYDRNGAAYLCGAPATDRAIGRAPLVQACRHTANKLTQLMIPAASSEELAS